MSQRPIGQETNHSYEDDLLSAAVPGDFSKCKLFFWFRNYPSQKSHFYRKFLTKFGRQSAKLWFEWAVELKCIVVKHLSSARVTGGYYGIENVFLKLYFSRSQIPTCRLKMMKGKWKTVARASCRQKTNHSDENWSFKHNCSRRFFEMQDVFFWFRNFPSQKSDFLKNDEWSEGNGIPKFGWVFRAMFYTILNNIGWNTCKNFKFWRH